MPTPYRVLLVKVYRKVRVLLIVGRDAPLGSLAGRLQARGWTVVVARSDQPETISLRAKETDVVVAGDDDLEGRCISILRSIREQNPDMPIILIGRRFQIDTAIQAIKLGRVEYLGRPISPSRLCSKVEDVLEKRQYLADFPGKVALQEGD